MGRRYNHGVSFRRFPPQLYALMAISLLCHVTMSGGRVTAGLYVLRAGYSEAWAGVLFGLYSLLPVLISLRIGRLVDRVGVTPVMRGAQAVLLFGLLVPVLWPGAGAVVVTALASGLGFNAFMLAAFVLVGQASGGDRALRTSMFAWVMLGNSVSAIFGPALAGALIDNGGFRVTFAVLAAIVGSGLVAGRFVPLSLPGETLGADPGQPRSIWLLLREEQDMQRVLMVSALLAVGWDAFQFLVPAIGHQRGYSATQIGLIMSAFAVGAFAVRLVFPWLTRHVGEWRLVITALLVNAGAFALMPASVWPPLMMTLAFVLGFCTGGAQPSVLSLLHQSAPPGRAGEAIGLRATINHFTGLTSPTVFGTVMAVAGAWVGFGAVAITMLGAAQLARRGEHPPAP